MPLPTDERLLALSQELLNQFDTIFGPNPGFRSAHAKATLLTGRFTPSANAASLTRAPHIENASTPRNRTIPRLHRHTAPIRYRSKCKPARMRHRFQPCAPCSRRHRHSLDGWVSDQHRARVLEFLRALATSDPKNPAGSPLEAFLGTHPKALTYVQTPKPSPSSFARKLLRCYSHA